MEKTIQRETAYPVMIGTLLHGSYVKAEAQFQPSYVKTNDGRLLSRVHLIGVIVSIEEHNKGEAVIDDGSGKILVRNFENDVLFSFFALGDVVRVIGKVRSFNEQVYLIPEIVKKITNKHFITLHKLQLQHFAPTPLIITAVPEIKKEEIIEEEIVDIPIDADETQPSSPVDSILEAIKYLDTGEGALMEEILEKTGQHNEKLLHHLLEAGDIFEIRPGRIKILE